jgi:hypothetical protein
MQIWLKLPAMHRQLSPPLRQPFHHLNGHPMLVLPRAASLNYLYLVGHQSIRLQLPHLRKGVAYNYFFTLCESLSSHQLTPAVSISNAKGVVVVLANMLKEHIGFKVLESNQSQNLGHGGYATDFRVEGVQ